MDDVIQLKDQFYILATSSRMGEHARVLKEGEAFAVFDVRGDIRAIGQSEQGIFCEGTRYLARLELRLNKARPMLLSSTIKEDNDVFAGDLTNPDITLDDDVVLPRGTIHIFRSRLLWKRCCYERIRIANYGLDPTQFSLHVDFDSDFADIFEVRGMHRENRGKRLQTFVGSSVVSLAYEGLDRIVRRTHLIFSPEPQGLSDSTVRYDISVAPHAERTIDLIVDCELDGRSNNRTSYDEAVGACQSAVAFARTQATDVRTSNHQFDEWLNRSSADLQMMISETPHGPYPYAGVPWFSVPFGRDGIITAMGMLWINPSIARGVLTFLAQTQAKDIDASADAEPGKILHEARGGEMAALGEHPFRRYYGSVDSTPLFIWLAAEYYERTGDRNTIELLWDNIERALSWIDRYGDLDQDGFIEYARKTDTGLVQQGWKDSSDSVFHNDGSLAEGPIALCEAQAYVFAAKRGAAKLAQALGFVTKADVLRREAEKLQVLFEENFWCEDLQSYVLALDGEKRPCRVRSSNAGHCLFAEIASNARARVIAEGLMNPNMFSGWGIRTLAQGEPRYNPMSYHNGSIWPHDNGLIALGMSRYGFGDMTPHVLEAFFDVSRFVDLRRLPELFCGFQRRAGEAPTLYPVACAPQAWASAAVYMMLQACLGISICAPQRTLRFYRPVLPSILDMVSIRNLNVGGTIIDIVCERHFHDVGVQVLRRVGDVEVLVVK